MVGLVSVEAVEDLDDAALLGDEDPAVGRELDDRGMDEAGQDGLVQEAGRDGRLPTRSPGRHRRGRPSRASAGSPGRGRRPGRWPCWPAAGQPEVRPRAPSRDGATRSLQTPRNRAGAHSTAPATPRRRQLARPGAPVNAQRDATCRAPPGSIRASRLQCARRDPSPPRSRPVCAPRLPPVRRGARDARDRCSPIARRAASRRRACVERDIEADDDLQRRFAFTIPVVALGDREVELATSPARLRRLLADVLDGAPDARVTGDYTFLLAVVRGRRLVPVAVRPAARAGVSRPAHRGRGRRAPGRHGRPSRWIGAPPRDRLRRAGSARSSRCSASRPPSPAAPSPTTSRPLRVVGGVLLVVMGLSLAGLLPIPSSSGRGALSMPAPPPASRR